MKNTNEKEIKILFFKYNEIGKPIKITMEGVGEINVTYDDEGEIEKVESESGNKMALKVTMAFQNLLSIVKPASVSIDTEFNSISTGI